MKRGYQYNFSSSPAGSYDALSRQRKAKTMVAVLADYQQQSLNQLSLLNVGGSAGVIDNYLANYFRSVVSIDIDELAISQAKSNFQKHNLTFKLGDAINLDFADHTFNVVICSHVYEHVPSAEAMMAEIFRVLAPGGICYFAGSNRFMWNEPHYNLPLLSAIPRPLAHIYIRLAKKADHYHELHYSFWGLKKLVNAFIMHDYTKTIINNPIKYHVAYMLRPGSSKAKIASLLASKLFWLSPGYIWLLEKPDKKHRPELN